MDDRFREMAIDFLRSSVGRVWAEASGSQRAVLVLGVLGAGLFVVGLLPAIFGYVTLSALGVILTGIAIFLWFKCPPRRQQMSLENVAERHKRSAGYIAESWAVVSVACGLGEKVSYEDAGGRRVTDEVPLAIRAMESRPAGLLLKIEVPPGIGLAEVEKVVPKLVHHYGAKGGEVTGSGGIVELLLTDGHDPLQAIVSPEAFPAPTLTSGCPVGRGADGSIVTVPVVESNLLVAGIPGSGKSATQTMLLAGLAQMPEVALVGLDPKRVELAPWRRRFSVVETNVDDMGEVLKKILKEVDSRYEFLQESGKKKWDIDDGPVLAVIVDELAEVTATGDKKADAERAETLRRIVALGRAAGVFVSLATQKPSADVVPTGLRDLIAQRVAMRCTTRQQAETVLGGVDSEVLAKVTAIPHELRGVGIFSTESGELKRARAAWVPDSEVPVIAENTAHLRVDLGWLGDGGPVAEGKGEVDV